MKRLLLVLVATLASACGGDTPDGPLGFETLDDRRATLAALGAARRLWNAQALEAYDVDFQRTCFCLERLPVRLSVLRGRIVRVVRKDNGAPLPRESWEPYLSVEQLFDSLDERARGGAYEVRVRFDARYGYPLEVWIDSDRQMADEELGFTLGSLMPGQVVHASGAVTLGVE